MGRFLLIVFLISSPTAITYSASENLSPIFIHGMWRTNSTYWWNLFRGQGSVLAFYEPLHPDLHHRESNSVESPGKSLRHPVLSRDRFAEYDELGIYPGFDELLAYRPFIWTEADSFPEVENYFREMIDAAQKRGKRPVFKLTRSFLKIPWFKKKFGGTHIYLHRGLGAIVNSYYSFRGPLGYYLRAVVATIGLNAKEPEFREVSRHLQLTVEKVASAAEAQKIYGRKIIGERKRTRAELTDAVGLLWGLGREQGKRFADLFIDNEKLNEEANRNALAAEIQKLTGFELSLRDYRFRDEGKWVDLSKEGVIIFERALAQLDCRDHLSSAGLEQRAEAQAMRHYREVNHRKCAE